MTTGTWLNWAAVGTWLVVSPQTPAAMWAGRVPAARASPDPLTKREGRILRLMAGGYSKREIADAPGTAEGTIKNHASSILSKLGVRDRTRAVLKALERGYI